MLITHCVADAWEKLHSEQSSLVCKAFQQTGISLNPDGLEDHLLSVKDLPDLAKDIGDYSAWGQEGLNCNLEPPVVVNGRKGESHTGDGLVPEDNWPRLLRLLDEKGALATEKEAKEHEEDDEFTAV
jgi:hypothetical protein